MTLVQKGDPEQAHRPTKWGPLLTQQKHKDKGQAQLQANNRRKQRNAILTILSSFIALFKPERFFFCYRYAELCFW